MTTIHNRPIEPGSRIQDVTADQVREQRRRPQHAAEKEPPAAATPSATPRLPGLDVLPPRRSAAADAQPSLAPLAAESPSRDDAQPTLQNPVPTATRPRLGRAAILFPLLLILLFVGVGVFHTHKPMPRGTSIASVPSPGRVVPLVDLTYMRQGTRVHEQVIFDRLFELIASARGFLVLDMFLFNDFASTGGDVHRALSGELTDELLALRARAPDLPIVLVTDPINIVYGGQESPHLDRLAAAGVDVVFTRLEELRDSNPLYSALYRVLFAGVGNDPDVETLVNPFLEGDQISLRSYLHLMNFKANHRKVAATLGASGEPVALVSSGNPHDASAAHSNLAFLVEGEAASALIESELQVAQFSGLRTEGDIRRLLDRGRARARQAGDTPAEEPLLRGAERLDEVQLLTEGAIGRQVLADLDTLQEGDQVVGTLFYLSWRPVVEAFIEAASRGVSVRLILDANRDAFGREKGGVPNRPVAHELQLRSGGAIEIRWYDTHGEQFHTKALMLRRGTSLIVHAGSANFTRRNLGDLNMEANVRFVAEAGQPLAAGLIDTFQRLWTNRDGDFTLDYDAFADARLASYWKYRFGEATGLSTF